MLSRNAVCEDLLEIQVAWQCFPGRAVSGLRCGSTCTTRVPPSTCEYLRAVRLCWCTCCPAPDPRLLNCPEPAASPGQPDCIGPQQTLNSQTSQLWCSATNHRLHDLRPGLSMHSSERCLSGCPCLASLWETTEGSLCKWGGEKTEASLTKISTGRPIVESHSEPRSADVSCRPSRGPRPVICRELRSRIALSTGLAQAGRDISPQAL